MMGARHDETYIGKECCFGSERCVGVDKRRHMQNYIKKQSNTFNAVHAFTLRHNGYRYKLNSIQKYIYRET